MYEESIIGLAVRPSFDRARLKLVEDSRTGCSRTRNSKARRPNGRDRFACPLKLTTRRVRYLFHRAISGQFRGFSVDSQRKAQAYQSIQS